MDLKIAKPKFTAQRWQAKRRNIEWLFTFEDWCKVWEDSGKWDQKGAKKGCYVMSRPGDKGPYSPTNVIIKLHEDNVKEAHIVGSAKKPPSHKGKKWSESRRANQDMSKINTIERANNISDALKAKYLAQGGSKVKGRKAGPEELIRRSEASKLMWAKRKAKQICKQA